MPVTDGVIGQELGYAEFASLPIGVTSPGGTSAFNLTTTAQPHAGLTLPILVPTNCRIFLEAEIPFVSKDATSGYIQANIFEDGTSITTSISVNLPASGVGSVRTSRSYAATPGFHVYELMILVSAGTATSFGGNSSNNYIAPYIRASVC